MLHRVSNVQLWLQIEIEWSPWRLQALFFWSRLFSCFLQNITFGPRFSLLASPPFTISANDKHEKSMLVKALKRGFSVTFSKTDFDMAIKSLHIINWTHEELQIFRKRNYCQFLWHTNLVDSILLNIHYNFWHFMTGRAPSLTLAVHMAF